MPDALPLVGPRPFYRLVVAVALAAAPFAGPSAARAGGPAPSPVKHIPPVVPGFERFYTGPKADTVTGGLLLLGELNCISCHKADAAQDAALVRRQAPVLDGLAARVRRSFLKKFLSDPQATKPGTAMPNVLAALSSQDRAQKAEELAHFLASTGTLKQERPDTKLIAPGRTLYHQVGCVACHGARDAAGDAGKLLPTSVPLGALKAKYSLASLAAFLERPHTTRPSGRMPSLLLDAKEARAVANYLLQGIAFQSLPPNLAYAYYEGNWDRLPDFDKLNPRAKGTAGGFDLTLARRTNNMAMRFEGYLYIAREGNYRFHLTSDDGSKLFLDGKLAVSNDGIHAPSTAAQAVRLSKGVHKLVAGVFNGGGGVELNVDIEGPGLGRQAVAPMLTLTPEGNPKVVEKKEEGDFAIDPSLVERGRAAFTSVGCASCHQLNDTGKPLASQVTAHPLAKLGTEGGCLAATPGKGVPVYRLSAVQRKTLAAAIKALAAPPREPPAPRDVIARALTTFNCYACHERGKVGGVEQALSPFFITTEKEMGEEGRVPPSLNGVGAKLNADYLKKVLSSGAHDRPYMLTRMPGFGEPNTRPLAKAFEAVDTLAPVAKVHFTEKLAQIKAAARRMVGAPQTPEMASQALGCIKCHTFKGHKAEGVQGIDMTLMPKRVRRDWFHRYVIDPQKFRPGTRMPSSWPMGQTFLTDVLGGDTDKQVEAIWVYLSDGSKALLPLGVKKQFIALVPDKEAIIYRNFLEGAGARAIGVGYPERAHLAFDANDLRLALIWQGAFMDASRHWTDRGVGFEPPLGDNILHLGVGPDFAVLGKEGAAWPKKADRAQGQRFLGYRLTPDQRPTFLYTVGGARVEDFPNAVAGKAAPSLKRTLTLSADQPVPGLWFRAAVGDKIEPAADGWYRVNDEYRVRVESAAPPLIRQSGGKKELLVPVRFEKGRARLVQEIVW